MYRGISKYKHINRNDVRTEQEQANAKIMTAGGSEWHEGAKLKENISILRLCSWVCGIGLVVYLSLRFL